MLSGIVLSGIATVAPQNGDYVAGATGSAPGIARGTGSCVFSSSTSASSTVTRGLAGTPAGFAVTGSNSGYGGLTWAAGAASSSQFTVTCLSNASISLTVPFTWVALL